jgi:TPR repeat protein
MDRFSTERLDRGLAAFQSRNYELAIAELYEMSLADNDVALTHVAEAMMRLKTNRDFKKIERIRIMAANLGNTLACIRLAEDYYDGMHFKEAEHYYLKAAEKGSNLAYRRLGSIHLNTFHSYFERAGRFKKAAEHGSAQAMFEYACLIELNIIEPTYTHYPSNPFKNWLSKGKARNEEAKYWYLQAAFAGNTYVIGNLMGIPRLRAGKPIMQDIMMMKDSIEKGVAQEDLFCLSVKGYFVLRSNQISGSILKDSDKIEAFELLRKAANKGNYHAMDTIADIYYRGNGVPKNLERALAWSLNAINSNPDFSPDIEGGGMLLCDIEEQLQLDVCNLIKQNPKKFCL